MPATAARKENAVSILQEGCQALRWAIFQDVNIDTRYRVNHMPAGQPPDKTHLLIGLQNIFNSGDEA